MKRFSQTKLKNTRFSKIKEIVKLSAVALTLTLAVVAINHSHRTVVQAGDNGLNASYFSNKELKGEKLNKVVSEIDFDWDFSSPFSNDQVFSARWQGQVKAEHTEEYTFTTFSDDGVRLWVDGKLLVDNWTDHPRTENSGKISLSAGQRYDIKLEYYENTGRSIMKLYWESSSQDKEIIPSENLFVSSSPAAQVPPLGAVNGSQTNVSQGLTGKYFHGLEFDSLQLSKVDSNLDFNWDYSALAPTVNHDTVSVRWEGQVMPRYSDEYTFYTISDDGVRVWVNNQLIIDNWTEHPATENSGKINLVADQKYNIKVEYFERYGRAVLKLLWSSDTQPKETIPSSHLFTSTTTNPAPVETPAPTPEPSPQPEPQPTTPVEPSKPTESPNPTPEPSKTPSPTPEKPNVVTSPIVSPVVSVAGNPLAGGKLYVNTNSQAQNWVNQQKPTNPTNAALVETIAKQSSGTWLGGWNSNVYNDVQSEVNAASSSGSIPTFVVYNIPNRDCGQHSAGGASTSEGYKSWIGSIASAIGSKKAIVILEPDALTLTSCLDQNAKNARFEMIKSAIDIFASKEGVAVYIDAGHPKWVNSTDMANLLKLAGVDKADGFALNTSNFISTAENISYGEKISALTGGKHFVIDTSRNGNGSNGEWCNPWGRHIGNIPTTNAGNKLVDAFLWVKKPGESDGNCNGGPSAGQFWPEYAISLVK